MDLLSTKIYHIFRELFALFQTLMLQMIPLDLTPHIAFSIDVKLNVAPQVMDDPVKANVEVPLDVDNPSGNAKD